MPSRTDKKLQKTKKKYKVNWLRTAIFAALVLMVIAGGIILGFTVHALKDLPDIEGVDFNNYSVTTKIMDKDGNYVEKLNSAENRIPVTFDEISPNAIAGLVAIEDQRFYDHNGVDVIRIGGAMLANLKAGRTVQGGSTIDQQLVGLVLLDRSEKSYTRKIREAALALKLDKMYSKDEIITFYLNRAYFGRGAYGIEAAANEFFSKSAKDLTVEESALLVGMIQNPSKWSPVSYPENALSRRNLVLSQMEDIGYLTKEQCEQFQATEITLNLNKNHTTNAEGQLVTTNQSFVDTVIEEALTTLGIEDNDSELYTGGYVIYTTLDPNLQSYMYSYYDNDANFPRSEYGELLQSSAVVIEPSSGAIRGLIGGRHVSGERQLNRVTQITRQTGSSIKPVAVYAPAFEAGYSPGSVMDDYPVNYNGHVFNNFTRACKGLMTYREAIKGSVNTVAVKVMEQIGVDTCYKFVENLGVTTLVPSGAANDKNLSLALGGLTKGMSPLELAGAYSAFANDGVYIKPYTITKIENMNGVVLYEHKQEMHVAMKESTAYMVNSSLVSVCGESGGTGSRAKLSGRPTAGKTGTTTDRKDYWFAGYTPQYACVVWMGYDQPKQINSIKSAGGSCGPVFKAIMEYAHQGLAVKDFNKPSDVVSVTIDTKSGLLPSELTPAEYQRSELFTTSTVPKETSKVWVSRNVCAESGGLYTEYCPGEPVSKVFLQREVPWQNNIAQGVSAPADSALEAPEPCTIHNSSHSSSKTLTLHATLNGNNVELSWNSLGDNVFYELHRGTSSGFNASSANLLTQTDGYAYTDSIDGSQVYYYYVVAYSKATNAPISASNELSIAGSSYSGPATPVNGNTSTPSKPSGGNQQTSTGSLNLSLSSSAGSVTLQWSAPGADNYQYFIFRGETANFTANNSSQIAKDTVITSTSYTDTSVSSGHTYYYKVLASDRNDTSKDPISASGSVQVN